MATVASWLFLLEGLPARRYLSGVKQGGQGIKVVGMCH